MNKKEETKERVRKQYTAKGERGQKMMSFRLDLENESWLEHQRNKGRYLNELIKADREARSMDIQP